MIKNYWKLFIAATSLLPSLAHAFEPTCKPSQNYPGSQVPAPWYFDTSKIPPFDPNVANGAILATIKINSDSGPYHASECNFYTFRYTRYIGSYPYLGARDYQTPKEGVGMRIRHEGFGNYLPYESQLPNDLNKIATSGGFNGNFYTFTFIFFKTGPITGRGSLTGEFARRINTVYNFPIQNFLFTKDIEIKSPTCSAVTGTQAVDLGKYPTKRFTGIGSTSDLKPFSINLSCSGGDENVQAKIYITLTDNTTQTNTSNTLSLAPDSTAKGIGIQVFKDSTLLGYGPDSSAPGNTNQWYAGSTGNGFFSIPLSARFIQTASTVTAGAAKGRMTFTISYQ